MLLVVQFGEIPPLFLALLPLQVISLSVMVTSSSVGWGGRKLYVFGVSIWRNHRSFYVLLWLCNVFHSFKAIQI